MSTKFATTQYFKSEFDKTLLPEVLIDIILKYTSTNLKLTFDDGKVHYINNRLQKFILQKVTEINVYGVLILKNPTNLFKGGKIVNITGNVVLVGNASDMFEGATNFIGDTSNWDLTRTTSIATENDIEYKLFNLPLPKSIIDIINGYTKTSIKIENISGDTKYLNIADFNNIIRGGELKTVDIYGVLKLVDPVMKFYGSTIETITGNVVLIGTVSQMFMNAVYFNCDLSDWNVSDVTDMTSMFRNASSFNSDISTWDVSNVRSMTYMFLNAVSFNQDISNWDVSNVMTMSFMFGNAVSFNQDISIWDTSKVRDLAYMFS